MSHVLSLISIPVLIPTGVHFGERWCDAGVLSAMAPGVHAPRLPGAESMRGVGSRRYAESWEWSLPLGVRWADLMDGKGDGSGAVRLVGGDALSGECVGLAWLRSADGESALLLVKAQGYSRDQGTTIRGAPPRPTVGLTRSTTQGYARGGHARARDDRIRARQDGGAVATSAFRSSAIAHRQILPLMTTTLTLCSGWNGRRGSRTVAKHCGACPRDWSGRKTRASNGRRTDKKTWLISRGYRRRTAGTGGCWCTTRTSLISTEMAVCTARCGHVRQMWHVGLYLPHREGERGKLFVTVAANYDLAQAGERHGASDEIERNDGNGPVSRSGNTTTSIPNNTANGAQEQQLVMRLMDQGWRVLSTQNELAGSKRGVE